MTAEFKLIDFFYLFGAAQGVLLSVALLIHKKGNRIANRLLAALVFAFSLRVLSNVAYWSRALYDVPHFTGVTYSFGFLFGPLLFLYAVFLLGKAKKFNLKTSLHFLPFLIHASSFIQLYSLTAQQKIYFLDNYIYTNAIPISLFYKIVGGLQSWHLLFYAFLTFATIRKAARGMTGGKNALQAQRVTWLQRLTLALGSVWLASYGYNLAVSFGVPFLLELDYFMTGVIALLIYAIGYMPLRQPEIFSDAMNATLAPRYENSSLSEERAQRHLEKLIACMEAEKPFLDSSLKLQTLAKRIAVSPHHLSQVINEKLQQNFFDFVNKYRVREAQKALELENGRRRNLTQIAYEVGFNNKTTFNSAFQKHTGLTPSEFRKSRLENSGKTLSD